MSSSAVRPKIVVVGSINMDLVVPCQRLPQRGETVFGTTLHEVPGGKGANQAVAAARLAADVAMVGRVGADAFATSLLENLRREGVNVTQVQATDEGPSGLAIVSVELSGENAITIVPGANASLTTDHIQAAAPFIRDAAVLMLQLEIPLETVLAAMDIARQHQTLILLDPAPAPNLVETGDRLLEVDLLCPNELEAEALTGLRLEDDAQIQRAAAQLCERGVGTTVITLGARGAYVHQLAGIQKFVPSIEIHAVDTTAAGDAFAAALAVTIASGEPMLVAVQSACVAGALAASQLGAQPAMPTYRQWKDRMHSR